MSLDFETTRIEQLQPLPEDRDLREELLQLRARVDALDNVVAAIAVLVASEDLVADRSEKVLP